MVWITALHLVLTALPGAAAALGLARRGVKSVPLLLVVGLAATGVFAMLAFWLYFAAPVVGQTFSFLVAFGSAGAVVWLLWERRIDGALLRGLAVPLVLWALGTYFLIFLGFLHGGESDPLGTAATRFAVGLPSDNGIPIFFAEWLYHHGHQTPIPEFPGPWQSSDRPPLQVGYVVSQMPFYSGHLPGRHYQAIGVALQQLWIVGLWALLGAARVTRVTKALAMITVLVSDLAIVNGFFIWPKMLPAAMLIAAAALVLTPLWPEVRRHFWGAALLAALLGIAMMGHGGSAFAVIPLVIVAAWRGLPSWRWIGVGVLVGGLLFMGPWSAYQRYVDPPGNRLVKYILAGSPEPDSRGSLETLEDSYSEVGLGGAIHEKAENYVTMVGGGPAYEAAHRAVDDVGEGNWSSFLDEVRVILFFDLLPSLGLLLIAPIAMALARGTRPVAAPGVGPLDPLLVGAGNRCLLLGADHVRQPRRPRGPARRQLRDPADRLRRLRGRPAGGLPALRDLVHGDRRDADVRGLRAGPAAARRDLLLGAGDRRRGGDPGRLRRPGAARRGRRRSRGRIRGRRTGPPGRPPAGQRLDG